MSKEYKEAIEFIKYHIADFKERTSEPELIVKEKRDEFLVKANNVVTLLKRGEAMEKVVEGIEKYLNFIQTDKGEIVWTEVNVVDVLKEIEELKKKYLKEVNQ